MHDIGLARQSAHTLVGLTGKIECLRNEVYLLAMSRIQVVGNKSVVGFINQFVV